MKIWPLALAWVLLATPHALADAQPVTVKTIVRTTETASGQPIKVPEHPELIVSTYEIAPHQTLPLHKHPYARYGYVLSGEITVDVRDGGSHHYVAGDVIVEVIDQWHSGSTGDLPVKLLVIDQVPEGSPTTILWEKTAHE